MCPWKIFAFRGYLVQTLHPTPEWEGAKRGGEGLNGRGMHLVQVVPLLCVSSLGCLCGDGHRSSSAGLNILFTSTLLERGARIRQESAVKRALRCVRVCICGKCFTFVRAWWKWHSPFSLDLLRVEGKHLRRRKYLQTSHTIKKLILLVQTKCN